MRSKLKVGTSLKPEEGLSSEFLNETSKKLRKVERNGMMRRMIQRRRSVGRLREHVEGEARGSRAKRGHGGMKETGSGTRLRIHAEAGRKIEGGG